MIDLRKHKLIESKKKPNEHTWRALEEMLTLQVLCDKSLISSSDKNLYLRKIFNDAKFQSIKDSSLRMKIRNYDSLISGASLKNINKYTVDVFHNSTNPIFQNIYNDLYINFWRQNTLKSIKKDIFINHDIQLFFSSDYLCSKYNLSILLPLSYFANNIKEYKKAIFKHVTPQHYVEHINAIGHLDKIIFLSGLEAKTIENYLNPNIPGDICDFMGMFIPRLNEDTAKALSEITKEKINKGETVILLCPENMEGMISSLKRSHPTILDMIDKVFSHEIGHLAFYFYYSELSYREDWRTIAEKQANWFCSISHNGVIDDLIEEVCSLQPPKYHYPILLKHKTGRYYYHSVQDLYLR